MREQPSESSYSHAPWTKAQVANLKRWQKSDNYPFMCPKCMKGYLATLGEPDEEELEDKPFQMPPYAMRPTREGWVCDTCRNTVDWAFTVMVDYSTKAAASEKALFGAPLAPRA